MPDNETPPPGRLEKILAAIVAAVIGLSVIAFFAIIIATWSGMQREDFGVGLWPTITLLPLFGLPLGFLVIIALLVVSTRRRRGQGGHGTS
jgi:phosphoglycerol transferase MdoB-like AlkP superfamily enzyme